MATEPQIFELCTEPAHLTNINWSNRKHIIFVLSRLIKCVSFLDHERQDRRLASNSLAQNWSSSLQFELVETLQDDRVIFGAVYKWSREIAGVPFRPPDAPEFVVAFRGTDIHESKDIIADLNILICRLHRTARFCTALDLVQRYVREYGAMNVWITGHSLGAATAMLVGRHMAVEGHLLQSHLFNPPFVSFLSPLLDGTKSSRLVYYFIKAAFVWTLLLIKGRRFESCNEFLALRYWSPSLYINPKDVICSGYVGYFDNQQLMRSMGTVSIANLAAEHSFKGLLLSHFGMEPKEVHLIPSATLITSNQICGPNFMTAHGIDQWWAPNTIPDHEPKRIINGTILDPSDLV